MASVPDLSLVAWDYLVMAIILAVPVLVSLWYAVRDKNKETRSEYLLGGQRMNLVPVALSLFVTFQSAVSLMGAPGEVWTFGTSYLTIYLGISLSFVLSAVAVVPLFYPLQVTSVYQYLQLRYRSQVLTSLISAIAALKLIFYLAIALLAPALALQASIQVPLWMSILLVGGVCTLYTSIGGIKSVIWTDAFQTVIVFAGILACIIKGSSTVGGFRNAWSIADDEGRIIFDKFIPDPRTRMTLFGTIIGGFFMWLNIVFDQSSLQRIRSMKSVGAARVSTLLNIPITLLYGAVLLSVSVVIVAYFSFVKCDPLKSRAISSRNQLAPYFVLHAMADMPGMAGFYLAAIFCGSLSTLSSGINALAAILVEGLLSATGCQASERRATVLTKTAVALFGLLIVGLAFCAQYMQGPVTQMVGSINGSLGSPVVGVFLLSSCFPWANRHGVVAGVLTSVAFMLTLTLGGQTHGALPRPLPALPVSHCGDYLRPSNSNFTSTHATPRTLLGDPLLKEGGGSLSFLNTSRSTVSVDDGERQVPTSGRYDSQFFLFDISYEWYSVLGTLVCMAVGLLVSWAACHMKPDDSSQIPPELIFPFLRGFWTRRGYLSRDTGHHTKEEPAQKKAFLTASVGEVLIAQDNKSVQLVHLKDGRSNYNES